MKKTKTIRLILDIIMALALVTLYSKNFLGIAYHEIAGLAVLVPIIIHICINIKIIVNMFRNFSEVPTRILIGLIVDVLLLIVFAWMGVSGVLISKTVLTGISSGSMLVKLSHTALGTVSLVLLGIHIGLHLYTLRLKSVFAILLTVLFAGLAVFGYMFTQNGKGGDRDFSSFGGGFSDNNMPDMSQFGSGDFAMPDMEDVEDFAQNGSFENMPDNAQGFGGSGMSGQGGFDGMPGNGQSFEGMPDMSGKNMPEFNSENMPDFNSGDKPDGFPGGMEGGMADFTSGGGSGLLQKAAMIAKALGTAATCAMLTYWLNLIGKRRKNSPPDAQSQEAQE